MAATATINGTRKAAIAFMVLGEEGASSVFRYLHEDEIERVAREIASLGSVPPELGEQVLSELNSSATASYVASGGVDQARRLLSKSLGPDHSRRILDRIVHSLHTTAGFASLERANPEQLSKFILGEHPQTTALILAHLNPGSAAQLLEQLPDDLRVDVLLRMANLGDIPPDGLGRSPPGPVLRGPVPGRHRPRRRGRDHRPTGRRERLGQSDPRQIRRPCHDLNGSAR